MTCPSNDELSQYVDELLSQSEHATIEKHLPHCHECRKVVTHYQKENQFIKQTLKEPVLPASFQTQLLDTLKPIQIKKKQARQKPMKLVLIAACFLLAVTSIPLTFQTAIGDWLENVFTSNGGIDPGLRVASEDGFIESVNKKSIDENLTFQIDDIIADQTRIAFSYQILDRKGQSLDPYVDLSDHRNDIVVKDEDNQTIPLSGYSWGYQDHFGLLEFSLPVTEKLKEKLTVELNIHYIHGREGNWTLNLPVDLSKSLAATEVIDLKEHQIHTNGIELSLSSARFSPSASELIYDTKISEEEMEATKKNIRELHKKFGISMFGAFPYVGNQIQYHIKNDQEQLVYQHNIFSNGYPTTVGHLYSFAEEIKDFGQERWMDTFIPQKDASLSFALTGIFKMEPANFSISFSPEELHNGPIEFEYEGNYMSIKEAQLNTNYHYQQFTLPAEENSIVIEIEGSKEEQSSELGHWVMTNEKGLASIPDNEGLFLDEQDKNGRQKMAFSLTSFDFEEMPEELTLHLVSVKRFYPLTEPWEIPIK
ncbi:anti-sigma factor family protein [Alkalihalobacillus trypoxylicola]|uniref:DUF4179 domain-containing protein n=1 Tax=Alkalihalobacillus trypoxylicola TaxID=519424 RepID=A0A162DET4_9BACI|nr:DUF4179 domain-containing protein [Alkalihalobacillus trypoxylicola]KYG29414.1 hypothetical protein AZF04_07775 [Alkalihalobacillus trypoxylicola]